MIKLRNKLLIVVLIGLFCSGCSIIKKDENPVIELTEQQEEVANKFFENRNHWEKFEDSLNTYTLESFRFDYLNDHTFMVITEATKGGEKKEGTFSTGLGYIYEVSDTYFDNGTTIYNDGNGSSGYISYDIQKTDEEKKNIIRKAIGLAVKSHEEKVKERSK